jgi:hypothetical protein
MPTIDSVIPGILGLPRYRSGAEESKAQILIFNLFFFFKSVFAAIKTVAPRTLLSYMKGQK